MLLNPKRSHDKQYFTLFHNISSVFSINIRLKQLQRNDKVFLPSKNIFVSKNGLTNLLSFCTFWSGVKKKKFTQHLTSKNATENHKH